MKLLFINACVRDKSSRTLRLARKYIDKIRSCGDVKVVERDLSVESIQFLTKKDFDESGDCTYPYELELAREFAQVDHIVIAAPFWEFEFPAILNAYIEMVSKAEIAFRYTNTGSVGLCKAQQLTYVYTAGGYLKEDEKVGVMKLKQLSKLYGIEEFHVIHAEGLDVIPEKAENIMEGVLAEI